MQAPASDNVAAEAWRLSRSDQFKAWLIATLAYPLIALLCRTFSWTVEGAEHWDAVAASGRQPILALWHGRILAGLHYFRNRGVVVITSRNFDGEWIARILERFGFGTARGSSSRGGARALVQMRRELAAGHPVAFTLDGPRGPARVAQPGAVWLAHATGQPLLPYHIEADRHWTLRSWDRAQIPKPFARVALVISAPIEVPAGSSETQLVAAQQRLESALSGIEARARNLADGIRDKSQP